MVQEKKAHYIAVIKVDQPTGPDRGPAMGAGARNTHRLRNLARPAGVPLGQDHGHRGKPGRDRFLGSAAGLRIHRSQENGKRQTRETVYAVTSLDTHQASSADLGGYVRGH
ncbi:hypothetical protein GCM10010252_42910 [Streptomyces aureoverticillatus]|nr:hypothetical protein GCM10010252_42910 [Streptomyces aureoverticillatus]